MELRACLRNEIVTVDRCAPAAGMARCIGVQVSDEWLERLAASKARGAHLSVCSCLVIAAKQHEIVVNQLAEPR